MLGFLKTTIIALTLLAISLPASARRAPSDWVLLGEHEVGFRVDRDTIRVDRQNARFSQLRIQSERNDIHIISVQLVYQNGYAERFRVDRNIKAGSEALPIDLRGERSYLKQIELVYRSDRDTRRRALVSVYGELKSRRDDARDRDFKVLMKETVRRRQRDDTVFNLRQDEDGRTRYKQIRFLARDGGVNIRSVTIIFGNNDQQRIMLGERLDDNELSRPIDLQGEARYIRAVRVVARAERGERSSELVLLGDPAGPDLGRFTRVEQQRITRRNDDGTVEFDLGRDDGRIAKLRLLAEGGDIFIRRATIEFGNGETQNVRIRDRIDEDTLSEIIDLAGESRFIRKVTVRARLARGEQNARLVLLALEDRDHRGRRGHRGERGDDRGDRRGGREQRQEWVTLGRENAALFQIDTDTFHVGQDKGKFSAIRATVERQAVHFYGMTIKYGNGSTEYVALEGMIRPGEYSQKIDLKGRDRFIDTVTFKYRSKISLRGSGVIEIQGLQDDERPSRRR